VMRRTLDDLEIWSKSILEYGSPEHGSIRDDTRQELDNDI
jgi:hypothetical protein